MGDDTDDEEIEAAETGPLIGQETAKYLDDRAADSFGRQSDLEQSIWGSIPLFSGGLIAFGAVIAATIRTLPQPNSSLASLPSYILCAAAMIAFAVAGFCLWRTIVPRDFEYPADDANLIGYAEDLMAFYLARAVPHDEADGSVVRDLRSYMAESFGRAAKSAFVNNTTRLTWRWRLINSLFYGFLIAFACDASIYAPRLFHRSAGGGAKTHGHQVQLPATVTPAPEASGRAADAPSHARDPGRGLAESRPGGEKREEVGGRRKEAGERGAGADGAPGGPADAEARKDRPQ